MGEATRALDWSSTPLGRADHWPSSLKTIVRMMLDSRYAMWLAWGPELSFFCNDAYRPTLGVKRNFLGAPASQVWAEIWPEIGPRIRQVLEHGVATWDEGLLLFPTRSGFVEETYHSFSYSPVHGDDGAVHGMLCVVTEDTARVLSARRLASLSALSSASPVMAGPHQTAKAALLALAENHRDLPFGMLYLIEPDAGFATLAASFGHPLAEARVRIDAAGSLWPLAEVMAKGEAMLVNAPPAGSPAWPASPWKEPIERAMVVPLIHPGAGAAAFGFLIAGISPHLAFDAEYRRYVLLAATQIAGSVAGARALADAQRQAEALAELDRAKTAFFSNVSHELRTPLTLILGPLRDLLEQGGNAASQGNEGPHPSFLDSLGEPAAERQVWGRSARRELELIERNAERLLKLVNMLLDFSRIEAGRLEARFIPTALGQLTRELAGVFRSSIEQAGLRFDVQCDDLPGSVDVDADLWEKIVLNLLANAFKFTFTGSIGVSLRAEGDAAVLQVTDTGGGIAAEQLVSIFDRFHRIEGIRARTHEGAGIGLALVAELVKLHHGRIDVASELGQGSTFTVTVPIRQATALPSPGAAITRNSEHASLKPAPTPAALNADQASRAEPPAPTEAAAANTTTHHRTHNRRAAHILVADDNADIRDYLTHLLVAHWNVSTAADGAEALRLMQAQRFDLVLTDVMMPVQDGFSLLAAMRRDPALAEVPVIMLSARAGEEARIEGLARGADEYLVKPFSSRELIARIDAQLSRAEASALRRQLRVELERRLSTVFENAPVGVALLHGAEHRFDYINREHSRMLGDRPLLGIPFREALPELVHQGFLELLDKAFVHGTPFIGRSIRTVLHNAAGAPIERYFDVAYQPMQAADGQVTGTAIVAFDVTDLNEARREAEAANRTKDEFLAVLGHELRNPLAPIVTALHLMQMRGIQGFEREHQILERQVGHMVRLVDDLLDVSRIFAGKLSLRKAPVSLAHAVSQALEATAPLFEQKRQRISVEMPQSGLDVLADSARLTQTVSNLLTNAARFTPAGGHVRVNVQRIVTNGRPNEWPNERPDEHANEASVVLVVEDEGVGMGADELTRIFEMFFQAPQRNDRADGGLGLGLAIARSLARQHGGDLTAASDGPGRGSRFTLTLPAWTDAKPPEAPVAATGHSAAAPAQRLLVVDDNRDAADSLAEAFRLIGHPTDVAYDPAQALALVREHPPTLAIVDIGLPAMDGIELTMQLKQIPPLQRLKVIALTGYGLVSDRARSRAAGIDAHVVKPVDVKQLTALVAQLLGG